MMASDETAPIPPNGTRKLNGEAKAARGAGVAGVIRDYIAVARGSDLVVIRVVGQGTMLTAPALAGFAEQQLKAGFRRFVFDLERCRSLDSTFLGMMVGIQKALGGDEPAGTESRLPDGPLPKLPPVSAAIEPPLGSPLPPPSFHEGEEKAREALSGTAAGRQLTDAATPAPGAEQMSPGEAIAALQVLFADPAVAVAELGKGVPLPRSPSRGGEGAGGGRARARGLPPKLSQPPGGFR